ncbi:CoA transferase [Caulobacter segnis]|uniref:L-carnitine dehydratase/bile acid-inducible protein F n=2 Tax=Caulobacter segnis TaxID=88688 RepID=D5VM21_CAUST|nr:CaiB/BaiF CoA-transferase family protein [Caulobacter segnis]ADG11544.1 L-carnitine dehydratase/bile acid-inducible protein F [Caulobacter segnis ATCC 21756]AVQ03202.1 CoA transferase [Caulobacter segnis]
MLEGLRVVELATYIAAPGAAGIMADWGADVIKVESPEGDPMRRFFDTIGSDQDANPVFELDNRGKRAVVLDIRSDLGREALKALVATADIFLTNVRPAALARAGLSHETLKAVNPRLIYASLTGYGLTGPDADKPGMDVAAFWSRAGVGAITAPKGSERFPIRTGMGDHVTSLATVSAILAAVYERERTGVGRLVETSLLRTGVYAIGSDMAIQLRLGKLASTRGRREAVQPLANFYKTADGRWICLLPRQGSVDWPRIAAAAGRPELVDDPRFTSAKSRREHGQALVDILDAAFGAMTYAQAAEVLDAGDITWAPYQTPRELAEDAQAEAAGCFVQTPDGRGGAFRAPAAPARFPGTPDGPRGPAPSLGADTAAVFRELGWDEEKVAALTSVSAA